MQGIGARIAATVASLVVLAGLAACGDRAGRSTATASEGARDVDAAVGVENKQAAQQVHLATLGAKGGTSVMDPDVLLAEQVKAALATRPEFGSNSHVDVHSKEGEVTLRGRAPDPTTRELASDVARSIPNVRGVDNQLTLG